MATRTIIADFCFQKHIHAVSLFVRNTMTAVVVFTCTEYNGCCVYVRLSGSASIRVCLLSSLVTLTRLDSRAGGLTRNGAVNAITIQ